MAMAMVVMVVVVVVVVVAVMVVVAAAKLAERLERVRERGGLGVGRVSSIPRKLYVFLADRMAGTSPEYIMCFPPLGLGY